MFRLQCELYNAALEERRGAWAQNGVSVSKFEQFKTLSGFDHPVMGYGVVPARGTLADAGLCVPGVLPSCQTRWYAGVSEVQTVSTLEFGRIP